MTRFTRFVVVIALAAANSAALAEWFKLEKHENITSYVDANPIREKNLVKVWMLFDSDTPVAVENRKPFLSMKFLTQYDCEKKLSRSVATYTFAKNMGLGIPMESDVSPSIQWRDVVPATIEEAVFQLTACKKAK